VNDIELAQRGEVHLQRVRLQRGDRAVFFRDVRDETPRPDVLSPGLGQELANAHSQRDHPSVNEPSVNEPPLSVRVQCHSHSRSQSYSGGLCGDDCSRAPRPHERRLRDMPPLGLMQKKSRVSEKIVAWGPSLTDLGLQE